MTVYLTKYEIRKIYLASRLCISNLNLESAETNVNVEISGDKIKLNNQEVSLNELLKFIHREIVLKIENNEIIQLFFETKDGRIYKIISNGDLDFYNIDISGQKLFSKKIPIKDLIDYIIKEVKGKRVLVVLSKGGYYSAFLYKLGMKVFTIEEDEYLIKLITHNPFVNDFFKTKYIITRLYYLKNIPSLSYDTIIYCPKPFNNPNRYYYSIAVFKELARIAKRRIIIDLEPPNKSSLSRIANNILLKFSKLKFKGEFKKEYGVLLLDRI